MRTIRRVPGAGQAFALLALSLPLLLASAAGAITLAETNPLFFPGAGANTGFDATAVQDYLADSGRSIFLDLDPGDEFLCAGNADVPFDPGASSTCADETGYELELTQTLLFTQGAPEFVHQNPQARGSTPSPSDPFIADSTWTVENTSGAALPDTVLLFTNVNLANFAGNELGAAYPDLVTGTDVDLLELVRFSSGGSDFFYAAAYLPALASGESVSFTFRYLVAGPTDLPENAEGKAVMPPISAIGAVVPEPGTSLLLATGLALLALRRRS